ncbi:MAG: SCO family protein [Rhodanobacter sp.]
MSVLRTLLASVTLLLAGGVALNATTGGFRVFTTESARRAAVRAHPVTVPPAALQTQSGTRINLADLHGKWLVVDFIYTRCPSYCIALGAEFAQLQDRLAGPIAQGQVQLLSISFDPTYDTPPQLAAYLQRSRDRGHGWIAARPLDADGLHGLKRAFGLTVIADGFDGYVHNAAIHVVDPRGQLVEIFDLGELERVELAVREGLSP